MENEPTPQEEFERELSVLQGCYWFCRTAPGPEESSQVFELIREALKAATAAAEAWERQATAKGAA